MRGESLAVSAGRARPASESPACVGMTASRLSTLKRTTHHPLEDPSPHLPMTSIAPKILHVPGNTPQDATIIYQMPKAGALAVSRQCATANLRPVSNIRCDFSRDLDDLPLGSLPLCHTHTSL